MKKYLLILGAILALALAVAVASFSGTDECADREGSTACTRVLFVGNSYTYVNDLPAEFARLASAAGRPVDIEMAAFAGATLAQHVMSQDTANLLRATRWDYAVLQEQSLVPLMMSPRESGASAMIASVREAGADPILFLTPARNEDWDLDRYLADQEVVDDWYSTVAKTDDATVAPVGRAWEEAVRLLGAERMWQSDGSHPSKAGTYLFACVFYATIFEKKVEGVKYFGTLDRTEATALQRIADGTVLGSRAAPGVSSGGGSDSE